MYAVRKSGAVCRATKQQGDGTADSYLFEEARSEFRCLVYLK